MAASLALAISALPSTGIAASLLTTGGVQTVLPAATTESPLELVPAGKLVLTTASGTGSVVRKDINDTEVGVTQVLSESGTDSCKGLGGADGALLKFTGLLNSTPGAQVGFSKGSIGVKETSSETFCNQIDTTSAFTLITRKFTPETLVIALPTGDQQLADPDFGPLKATSASLDVELRNKDSRILVTASLEGTPKAYYELRTGTFRTATLAQLVPGAPYDIKTSDAGSGANFQWAIGDAIDGVTFDSLSIRAYNGAVSLEGGADLDSAAKTSIELGYVAKDVLSCGETLTSESETATVRYLAGATPEACSAGFSAVLSSTDEEVRFLKPLSVSPDAQFIFDITWRSSNSSAAVTVPTAKIDFEFPGIAGAAPVGFTDMDFCPDALYSGGELTGLPVGDSPTVLGDFVPPAGNGTQFACLDKKRLVTITDSEVTITDKIYVIGDAKMRL